MKKYLIVTALFIGSAYAMCSIDEGATVCSVPNFREQVPLTYSPQFNIHELSETPETGLNSLERNIESESRIFAPAESNYSYNSSCQFGVCMQNRSTPLFQQPKQ